MTEATRRQLAVDIVYNWDKPTQPARIGKIWNGLEPNPDSPKVEEEGETRYRVLIGLIKPPLDGDTIEVLAIPRDPFGEDGSPWGKEFMARGMVGGMLAKILAVSHLLVPPTVWDKKAGMQAKLKDDSVEITFFGRTYTVSVKGAVPESKSE